MGRHADTTASAISLIVLACFKASIAPCLSDCPQEALTRWYSDGVLNADKIQGRLVPGVGLEKNSDLENTPVDDSKDRQNC